MYKNFSQIKASYLEGQLNSCRKTIERLEQELKKWVHCLCLSCMKDLVLEHLYVLSLGCLFMLPLLSFNPTGIKMNLTVLSRPALARRRPLPPLSFCHTLHRRKVSLHQLRSLLIDTRVIFFHISAFLELHKLIIIFLLLFWFPVTSLSRSV